MQLRSSECRLDPTNTRTIGFQQEHPQHTTPKQEEEGEEHGRIGGITVKQVFVSAMVQEQQHLNSSMQPF